ncbi:MAG TPA: NAD(P)-dependent oxidoreductase [Acidimicrobiales bacterium]|nr:NAD(P)-dependent oxidoreductase [Acidimicrobiales bacterium]
MGSLRGEKILFVGPTGQVGKPLALALAAANEVWGLARFKDTSARSELESAGMRCVVHNLATDDVSGLPDDFTYVLNFGVVKSGRWDRDLAANAEAIGPLMYHCRGAKAFLHCSSTAVYQADGHHRFAETDPLGDNHRVLMPTYSISKIAAEAMVRSGARQWGVPTTIARLNVPYGDNGGWPLFHLEMILAGEPIAVHRNAPSVFNPIHEADIIAMVPRLLEVADVPATIVNWAGRDAVSIEEWSEYLGQLVGRQARFEQTELALESVTTDNSRLHELVGETTIDWRDGMRQMVAAQHPELTLAAAD